MGDKQSPQHPQLLAAWVADGCPNYFHTHISKGRGRWKHLYLWLSRFGGWQTGYAAIIDNEEHPHIRYYEAAATIEALLHTLAITDQKLGVVETTVPTEPPLVLPWTDRAT